MESTMVPKDKIRVLGLIFLLVFAFYTFNVVPSVISWGPINNYLNFSTRTTVNITDAMPEILNVTCNSNQVTLVAGATQNVSCVIELRDFNGGDTINGTNGSGVNVSTFYFILNQSNEPDDNNTHYTNNTCTVLGTPNGFYINWTCGFSVWYYANNGTWTINVSVHDRYNNKSYNVTGYQNVTINPLYALNVTDVIDFGDMFVGETSQTSVQANITNFGNMNINVSVYGFGGDNQTLYPNLAMVCTIRNLSLTNERYSSDDQAWSSMTAISASAVLIPNITIPQQQIDSQREINTTYWRLFIDPTTNPFGQCNGTVVFSAVAIN